MNNPQILDRRGTRQRHSCTRWLLVAFPAIALLAFSARSASAPIIEIRFCPASAVHTYPLESRRDLQSLMLQNLAVINHGDAPFKIDSIELELLQSGQVLDSKKLDSETVKHFADRGAKMQAAGV